MKEVNGPKKGKKDVEMISGTNCRSGWVGRNMGDGFSNKPNVSSYPGYLQPFWISVLAFTPRFMKRSCA